MTIAARKLFFLRENPNFPEGTLFELEDGPRLTIPDRGDSESVTCDRTSVIECPPFAENVPPGQCPVRITSFSRNNERREIAELTYIQNIHEQVIEIPLPVATVIVTDRVTQNEVDSYYPSGGQDRFVLHVGHLRPGFYDAKITAGDESAEITFIKLFPPRFSETYSDLTAEGTPADATSAAHLDEPRTAADEHALLLNKVLELATEWGENFLKPIHDRLRVSYPELTDAEIDALTATAREAESLVYKFADEEARGLIHEREVVYASMCEVPWMSYENASRLANIGGFYARR